MLQTKYQANLTKVVVSINHNTHRPLALTHTHTPDNATLLHHDLCGQVPLYTLHYKSSKGTYPAHDEHT